MTSTSSLVPRTNKPFPDSNHSQHLPALPSDAHLSYLAEGAANVVFKVSLPDRTGGTGVDKDLFKDNLVRLRKDLPTTPSILTTHTAYATLITPLFPPHLLLDQTIISLPRQFIPILNHTLLSLPRPASRHGSTLAPESHGLLVRDMSPPPYHQLVEFKPKWLVQSPSAPTGATRCRTCALRTRRNALHYKNAASKIKSGYCPLDLISPNKADIENVAWSILFPKVDSANPGSKHMAKDRVLLQRFIHFLYTNPIFPLLRRYQMELDRSRRNSSFGLPGADRQLASRNGPSAQGLSKEETEKLLLAYTLRDCSVFVLIPEREDEQITAKIGDLDLKSELKVSKWSDMERELREEGWYNGPMDGECFLSRAG